MNDRKNIPLIIKELQELADLLKMIEGSQTQVPEMLCRLIEEKSDEIHTYLSQIRTIATPCAVINQDIVVPEIADNQPLKEALAEEQPESVEVSLVVENVPEQSITSVEEELVDADPAEEVPCVEPAKEEPNTFFHKKEDIFDLLADAPKKEEPVIEVKAIEINPIAAETKKEEPEVAPAATLDDIIQRHLTTDIRKAISLNDRFRFKRELFGNNEILMSSTLDNLNAAPTYGEALTLLRQFHWDAQSETVTDFMAILEKRFAL